VSGPETYEFPTWRSAIAYIEELVERGGYVIQADGTNGEGGDE